MILRQTSKEEFLALIKQAKEMGKQRVPIWIEMAEDMITPVLAFLMLKKEEGDPGFLYESVESGERVGRWSYVGVHPFRTFTCRGRDVTIIDHAEPDIKDIRIGCNPRKVLEIGLAGSLSMLVDPSLPVPFAGGLVGNIGYDTIRLIEPTIPDTNRDDLGLPDITLMYYDIVLAFDHVSKKVYVICSVPVEGEVESNYRQAMDRLEGIHDQLLQPFDPRSFDLKRGTPSDGITSNMTKAEFKEMVARCKEYLKAGDVIQVVVSQRWSCPLEVEPFTIYRHLRRTNPAPYLFYLDFGGWQMIGSSPEIMVQVTGDQVMISPIAGTSPRGKDDAEDDALAAKLLADEKERAEHIMLVDLARNDIGRVAKLGKDMVKVVRMMYIVMYSTVIHIVSDVIGTLADGTSSLMALLAGLPAGTLVGAPKIRAMEIIDELEPTRRGPYGGCVGFLSFTGDIETAIVIRTAVVAKRKVWWQAGSGIVADSNPDSEYEESRNKGKAIFNALIAAGNTLESKEVIQS
jgi:anthranilate synthase component 1